VCSCPLNVHPYVAPDVVPTVHEMCQIAAEPETIK